MKVGPQPSGLLTRRRILSAAAKVFLEKGYAGASSRAVAELAGVSNGSPFYLYGNKEGVLLELVKQMFANQFAVAGQLSGAAGDPLLLYAAETALQIHITEQRETLRELYVTAYTLPRTAEYIYRSMLPHLAVIFGPYLEDTSEQTLYEMELASAGVTRSFMNLPCSEQFPLARKLRRYLSCCFRLYGVPAERYEPIIEQALQMDLQHIAAQVVENTVRQTGEGFEAAMAAVRK